MTTSIRSEATRSVIVVNGVDQVAINSDGSMELLVPNTAPTGNDVVSAVNFDALKLANGYQKLPSGLIIQWGTSGGMSGSPYTSVNVTFPVAFPNAAVACVAMSTGAGVSVASNGPALTSVSLINSTASTSPAKWFAIGY